MAGIPDCTVTTACYVMTRYHPHARSIDDSLRSMETLLAVPCYLVIYCNKDLEEPILERRASMRHLTKVVVQEFEDLWCYSLLEKVRANRETFWPTRDARTSAETHLITCNKADFVLQTIASNPFQTTKFAWIDSNLGPKACKISHTYQNNMLLRILHQLTDKFHLQIMNVTDKKYKEPSHKREYYMEYRWIACGCLFSTTKAIGITILNRIKELIIQTTQMGYGHGEEMFYLEILDEFYDDIHRAYGDYQDILHNFIQPTTNFVYVYWNIVMKYHDMGYHKECIDVCRTLIRQFDEFALEMNYDLYVRLYTVYYHSMREVDAGQAEEIALHIRRDYQIHPLYSEQFRSLRSICKMEDFSLTTS